MRARSALTSCRHALIVVAGCLLALLAGAGPVSADGFHGVNVQAMVKRGIPHGDWPLYVMRASELGFSTARSDGAWSWVEPHAPVNGAHTYDWTRHDELVQRLAERGIRWLPVLNYIPGWARAPDGSFPESSYGDWAAFATALVQRYGPGGAFWSAHPELQPVPVHAYEVWTEPNSSHFWAPTQDAGVYAAAFSRLRSAIKDVDPSAKVMVSLGWQNFETYVDGLAATGRPDWAGDGIAFHPYAPTALGILDLVQRLRARLVADGAGSVPISATELGLPRAITSPGARHTWDGAPDDATRAATLALTADALARSDCRVDGFMTYSLVEPEADAGNAEDWMGLVHVGGAPTRTGLALKDSEDRIAASPASPASSLCGSGTAAAGAAALPLELELSMTSPSCASVNVRYHGDPAEQISVNAYGDAGDTAYTETDAYGNGTLCLARAPAQPMLIKAYLSGVATSPVLQCQPPQQCVTAPPNAIEERQQEAPPAPAAGGATTSRPSCPPVRMVASRRARPRHGRVRLSAKIVRACGGMPPNGVRLVLYRRAASGAFRSVRSISLRKLGTARFSVRVTRRDSSLLVVLRPRLLPKRWSATARVTLLRARR